MIIESPSPRVVIPGDIGHVVDRVKELIEVLRRLMADRELARASAHAGSTSAQSEVVAT